MLRYQKPPTLPDWKTFKDLKHLHWINSRVYLINRRTMGLVIEWLLSWSYSHCYTVASPVCSFAPLPAVNILFVYFIWPAITLGFWSSVTWYLSFAPSVRRWKLAFVQDETHWRHRQHCQLFIYFVTGVESCVQCLFCPQCWWKL